MPFYRPDQLARTRRVIGLMSGTSADSIDAAAVEITGEGDEIHAELAAFIDIPHDVPFKTAIFRSFGADSTSEFLTALNTALGERFADAAIAVRDKAGWPKDSIDAVGSHGQTAWHQPDPVDIAGLKVAGTLQLGNPAVIAERVKAPVVSDFRSRDVAVGGQGAPLVPLIDWLLYRSPSRSRSLVNIGGIANLTYLPKGCQLDQMIAFDTGPGNMAIDAATRLSTDPPEPFDRDGKRAASGNVNLPLLEELLAHPFLAQQPPKSTGREVFGEHWTRKLIDVYHGPLNDLIATLTALTSESIVREHRDFLPGLPDEMILSGGGSRNGTLVRMIQQRAGVEARTAGEMGWNSDAKEAVAFAILADRTMQGLPGNAPSATGAERGVILGSVTLA